MATSILRFLAIILSLVAFLMLPQIAGADTIHVGDIGPYPADIIKRSWPFVNYLANQLKSEGIDQGKVVVARNIPDMANYIKEGKVDLFVESPFPAVAVSRLSGSKFLLRRWRRGLAEYRAVIFVRKDSGINRLADLKGKTIAFETPLSTSTYFLPKLVMVREGLKLSPKEAPSDAVDRNEVGYLFLGDDPDIMLAVVKGKVSAGALNNVNYLGEARNQLGNLKVIHETFSIPRQVISYRPDLSPKLVARVKEILIKMDQSEEGKKTLREFDNTTKFDEIPDGAMAPLLKAAKFIDAEFDVR